MAKDPAFLFYPGDYLRDTQMLSEKTQVAYDRIMCEHMRNICISQKQLKFLTKRLNEDELDELMMILEEVEGGYQITWVAESIIKRREYSESRRKNRSSKKKKDTKKTSLSYDKHMENENENEDVNRNKERVAISQTFAFEDFWDLYDHKLDRKYCENKWQKLSDTEKEKIMQHVPLYVAATPDKKYRRHPKTYLNNENWKDEDLIKTQTNDKRTANKRIDEFTDTVATKYGIRF